MKRMAIQIAGGDTRVTNATFHGAGIGRPFFRVTDSCQGNAPKLPLIFSAWLKLSARFND